MNHAHQSFTSLPAITAGYGPPSTGFPATAAAPGALVVAAPSAGYGGYGIPQGNNPYGGGAQPSSNPYASANPYALAPAPNSSTTAPYQYAPPQSYSNAPATQNNAFETVVNPYGAAVSPANPYITSTAAAPNPYAAPTAVAPIHTEQPPQSTNPYGVAAAPSNPYLAPIPAASTNPYVAPSATNPYGNAEVADNKSAWTPPAPITTQPNPYDSTIPTQPYETFNGGFVPQAVTPHAQQTPSSLGFGSPAPDFSGFTPSAEDKRTGGADAAAQLSTPFGNLTMNGLASVDEDAPVQEQSQQPQQQSTSVIQSTFAKLANLDNFSVSSNSDAKRVNPFESPANASVGGGRSLADMAKNKVSVTKTCKLCLRVVLLYIQAFQLKSHLCSCTDDACKRDYENTNASATSTCRCEPIWSIPKSIWNANVRWVRSTCSTAAQHVWSSTFTTSDTTIV